MRAMKTSLIATVFIAATSLAVSSFAQPSPTSPAPGGGQVPVPANPAGGTGTSAATGQPNAADMEKMMQQMMELSKLNENHKLLASLDGTWNCEIKMWMDGDTGKKPEVSKSTAVRKSIMDGRYVIMDVTGKMEMPGPDGKKKEVTFKGQGTEGYD